MGLDGLVVLDSAGIVMYSNILGIDMKNDPFSYANLQELIKNLATQLLQSQNSQMEEMITEHFNIVYKQLEFFTFIGMLDEKKDILQSNLVLEYTIMAFFAKFYAFLQKNPIDHISKYKEFDDFFLNYRNSSEKQLSKWLEEKPATLLQGILNKFTTYISVNDLIKFNSQRLSIIGKKLIWVSYNVNKEEENQILDRLKKKSDIMFGPKLFDNIKLEISKKLWL